MKTLDLDRLLAELRQQGISLWVEGDRLRYRAAKDSLTPELLAEIKSRKVEIIDFLNQATERTSAQLPPIEPINRDGHLPLSFAQQRLWFLHQLEPDSSSNNMPVVVRFTGSLNVSVLEQSLQALVHRHEVLRTHFPAVNGQPTQVITSEVKLNLPLIDVRPVAADQRDREALRIATEEAHRPFDLANGPILRLLLLRLSNDEHLLVWNMHCMICDGASSDVFYRDLTALYKAFSTDKPSPLPELPVQYADFAYWQRQWLQGEVLASQVSYWKKKLEGASTVIQLPTDHPRPPLIQTYRGARSARMLPKSLNISLNSLSHELGGTLFMTLIAAFETLLHRYSQQNDILISFASAGRGQVETEGLVGFFSNTLIQRINFDGDPTFRELFDRVREASLEAYVYQDLPFEKLVEELPPELSNSRSPLFQVKFALNPPWSNGRGMASVNLPDLNITSLFGYIYHGKTKYDLILVIREQDEGLGIVFDYNADLFEANTIAQLLGHLEVLLESIVAKPDEKISNLPLLTSLEQQQILQEWNQSSVPIPETFIHQLFEFQVKQSPDAIAVVYKDQQFTYRELNNQANQLAHYLKACGVGSETLVALCIEKSPEMLVGMLGTLKAGGAYIPLDPSFPHQRRASKLRNAKVTLGITKDHLRDSIDDCGVKLICLDTDWEEISQHSTDNLPNSVTAENLAYVIYTSGSTGEPKGVMITHRGMVNHSLAVSNIFELTPQDRVLQFSNISFDIIVEEIFPTLLSGGTLVLPPPKIYTSITSFLKAISKEDITVINLPTAFWHELVNGLSFIDQPLPQGLRLVVVGGEKVSKSTYRKWRSLVGTFPRWLNTYGSTETTVTATIFDPLSASEDLHLDAEVPIGKAISNLQTYVLDRNLKLSPVGVAGELYIGGAGLSRGYLNRPDITAKRFIPNPFSEDPQARLYKTGDTVRYLPDGNLEFIGRVDFQIKIRGYRVEPIEIETQLEQYFEVKQAVVLCQDTSTRDKSLVGYLAVKDEQTFDLDALRAHLQQRLPVYMLPNCFVILESLPLTPNGKIDRRALLKLELEKQRIGKFIASRDEVELKLANIWEKLLGRDNIGIYDNFFELGGNSLLSVRLVSEIEKTFNCPFPLSSFLQISTIAAIAQLIREKPSEKMAIDELPSGLCWEDYRALMSYSIGREGTHLGKRGLIVEVLPDEMKSSQPFIWVGDLEFSTQLGLQQPIFTMSGAGWETLRSTKDYISAVATLLIDELLEVHPVEPYYIGASCFLGWVAMEMAQQLRQRGKDVAILVLVDRHGPSTIQNFFQFRIEVLFLYFLRVHFLTIQSLPFTDKWSYIKKLVERKIKKIKKKTTQSQNEFEPSWVQMLESLNEAASNYQPEKYPGKVVLIESALGPLKVGSKDIPFLDLSWIFPHYGWEGLLTGKVELYRIPCRHLEVNLKSNAEKFGRFLLKILKE
jgi:amino acid adenylation domain-containing protein